MLRTPEILRMSMATQKNRRLLVVTTYSTLLICVAIILILPPLGGRNRSMWLLSLPLVYNVVSYAVFGKLVEPTALPTPRGGEMTGLGLAPRRRNVDEPDERDVAIRNGAHYQAFRAAAVYCFALWVLIPLLWSLKGPTVILWVLLLLMPLFTMLLTLPQAIILWTQPDVPEEARV